MKIKGVIVPLLTLFDESGDIDEAAMGQLAELMVESGVQGLFPAGTTGEGPLLTTEERKRLAEIVVQAADGRVPTIVHTGTPTTAEAIELSQHAQSVGAQAAALVAPYYFHHSDEALFRHFEAVANQTPDLPIYLYNFPTVACNTLSFELIARLVEHCPNIAGLKDSSGSLETLKRCATLREGTFNTTSGPDSLLLAANAVGVDACVSGNGNVVPELIVALHRAASEGQMGRARELQRKLDGVRGLLEDGRDLSLFKGVLAKRGLPVATLVRAPLLRCPEAKLDERWLGLLELLPELESKEAINVRV